jgi:hypothetical protein
MYKIEMIGKKFGTLMVIAQTKSNNKGVYWECICKCGVTINARGSHLRSGNIKSCGSCFNIKEIGGRIYGKLKVLYLDKYEKRVRWVCECVCGNKISVQAE